MVNLLNFLYNHWVSVVLLMTMILFLVWLISYFANGMYGYHFELTSCWTGIGTIVTAAGTGGGKCFLDNKFSSSSGQDPDARGM